MTQRCSEYLSGEQILFAHINLELSEQPSAFVLESGSVFTVILTNKEKEAETHREREWPEKRVNHGGRVVAVAAWGQRILMSPL